MPLKFYSQSFQNSISTTFLEEEFTYNKGEIITNVLKIKNLSNKDLTIKVKIFAPSKWKSAYKKKNTIEIQAYDSIFVPVRIVPQGKVIGNTKFFINAIIYSKNDNQIGSCSFYVGTKKHVNWIIGVEPDNKLYFKNNENEIDFGVNIFNIGNYDQDILFNIKTAKESVQLMDSSGLRIDKPIYHLNLAPNEDTTFKYVAKVDDVARNFKSVSLTNHKPNIETTERTYSIFMNSVEPRVKSENAVKKGQKLRLIKLPNEKQVSLLESGSIPLTINGNIQNVLGKSSFMSLILNGRKEFEDNSFIYYSTNLNYTTNYLNQKFLNNLGWTMGYLNERYALQIGQINGGQGILASGQGISGKYKISPRNEVGAAYIRSPNFFSDYSRESIGLSHEYSGKKGFRFRTSLTHSYSNRTKQYHELLSFRSSFKVFGSHKIGLFASFSESVKGSIQNLPLTNPGYLAGFNYSNIFLNKKLNTTFGVRYNPKEYGFANTERLSAHLRNYFKTSKSWQVYLNHNYLETKRSYTLKDKQNKDSLVQYESLNFSNQINFAHKENKRGIQPGFFYNILGEPGLTLHSRGVNFRFTKFNFNKNILFSTHLNMGYNDPVNLPNIPDYFIFQFSSLFRYRTLSFNTRYMYGPNSMSGFYRLIEENHNPQNLRLSLHHQYLFKNSHFILQSSASYSYNNRFKSSNFGLFPELFYYTSSGWRFSLNANYSASSNNFKREGNIYSQNSTPQEDIKRTINQGMTIGVSFKKEIGIPNPFTKNKSVNVEFISFFDLNGNSKWEKDEPTLENVVINVGENKIISNKKGAAILKNISSGKYVFYAFSLEKLGGWFPNIPDSITLGIPGIMHIPFVKGVKIKGDVFIEREELNAESDKPFDLTNIKITATSKDKEYNTLTNFNGEFEFYVPNGNYILTLDKGVLSDRFKLLRNGFELILSENLENVYTSFQIIERKRRVKIKKFKQKE